MYIGIIFGVDRGDGEFTFLDNISCLSKYAFLRWMCRFTKFIRYS